MRKPEGYGNEDGGEGNVDEKDKYYVNYFLLGYSRAS